MIKFSSHARNKHRFMGLAAASPFTMNGYIYGSMAHYYYSEQCERSSHANHIKTLKNGLIVLDEWKSVKFEIRKDWEEVRDFVLIKGLMAKYQTPSPIQKSALLSTGTEFLLFEDDDPYLGFAHGIGKNQLGIMTMRVRQLLRGKVNVAANH